MHCTADTETGDYLDDPSEAQLTDLIAALGASSGSFLTLNPASHGQAAWYASVGLLPGGSLEIIRADPDHGENYRTTTTASPATIARDLTTWLTTRS